MPTVGVEDEQTIVRQDLRVVSYVVGHVEAMPEATSRERVGHLATAPDLLNGPEVALAERCVIAQQQRRAVDPPFDWIRRLRHGMVAVVDHHPQLVCARVVGVLQELFDQCRPVRVIADEVRQPRRQVFRLARIASA